MTVCYKALFFSQFFITHFISNIFSITHSSTSEWLLIILNIWYFLFILKDCKWKSRAGNPCAASFDWSCSGILNRLKEWKRFISCVGRAMDQFGTPVFKIFGLYITHSGYNICLYMFWIRKSTVRCHTPRVLLSPNGTKRSSTTRHLTYNFILQKSELMILSYAGIV